MKTKYVFLALISPHAIFLTIGQSEQYSRSFRGGWGFGFGN